MKFKKWLNKVTKIFVVLGMVLSMCFTAGNTNTVEAWDSGIPHEFTRIKSITYPKWWKRKCPQITKQWSTYMCKYNGQWSYCLEASKKTPSSGNYAASVIENNVMVRKFLYYGFGGPNGSLFRGQALTDDGLNEEETGYLYTHVLLSLAYSGDMCGANIDDLERAGIGLKSTWSYVESLPDPSNGANFSTGDTAKFTATFDKANMIQTTNTVSFNASSNETVQLPLQSNVTIHIAGSSAQQTGGTATVWGGQSFYLTAPLENSPTDYTSGTLNSSVKGKFCALAISDGNGSNQTHGSWTQESVDTLKYSVDWLDFGWIDLVKKTANESITDNNGCYSLEGAVYGIYSDGTQVDTITTDKDGYAKSSILPVGKYTVKEIIASTGYDLDEETHNVTIVKDQTVRANSDEIPGNDPIGIEIVKNDAETLGMPQGDATLEGAEFTVTYYADYYTKEEIAQGKPEEDKVEKRTWVLQTKKASTGQYIASLNDYWKVSGDELYKQDGMPTLPLGTISIKETKAPKGYLLKGNTLNVTNNATGTTSTVEDSNYVEQITKEYKGAKLQFGNDANELVVTEKVKKQKIQIFKSGYRNGMSEVVKGLQGAEFAFKLKSEVDHVGWDNATVYDVVTTNEDGLATTKYLPFGEYLVRETVTPKDYYTNPDFTVSITKDHSEYENEEDQVKKVVLNNRPVETQLKLVKQDEETGKTVSLNSASFKIVADEDILDGGNIVYKKGQYITQKVGGKKYDTFTTNSDNVVVVKTEYTNDDDEKGEVFLPLQFFAGKYHLEEVKVPTGFIGLGKTQSFEMSGLLDYTKDEDGDPIYTVTVRDEQPKGEIKLNKTVADLDTDVDLVDRSDLSKIQFVLKAKENIYSPVDGSLMFAKDDVITTENSGAIVNSGTEVGNGVYALSTDGHLDISNLPMGVGEAQYYLQEVKTLDGCVLDTTKYDAVFKQSDYTTKTYIKSFDVENLTTDFEFNKTDVTGDKEVEGAQLTITDEDGNVVDQWTSTNKVHSIEGLVEGKKYTLHEDLAPTGLNLANDIEFEVSYEKENQQVEMIDTINEVSKVDEKGNLLKGAEMTVTSNKTKNIIDKWISGQHIFDVTDEMKAQLKETGKAEGMYVDDEDSTVQYSIAKNKGKDDYTVMFVKDGVTTYTNIDLDGNETRHMIQGLEAGEEYVLKETKTPNGYATFKTQTFTAEEGKDTVLSMTDEDTKIEISKQDITTKKELEGAKLKVTDKDGKVIDEWTSGKQPHMIKNLTAGETYTLTEVIAPKNYKVAESIQFTVKDTGVAQKVVMYDELLPVKKVKTGDNSHYEYYLMLTGLAVVVFGMVYFRKKHA